MWKRVAMSAMVAVLGAAVWQASEAQTLTELDRSFMIEAARGGAAEVALGQLAATRAQHQAIRQFGQRMAMDHGAANAQLAALASRKGVALDRDPATQHRATYDRLAQAPDFDRAYMVEMVEDHDRDVREFERASQTAYDAELRAWATQSLPTLREHQRLARQLASALAQGPPSAPAAASPAALPAAAVIIAPGSATAWCQGVWDRTQGTSFGACPR